MSIARERAVDERSFQPKVLEHSLVKTEKSVASLLDQTGSCVVPLAKLCGSDYVRTSAAKRADTLRLC
ncbi:MAG: hypothetical protein EON54_23085 [Alcaligenaceae bacterium]|nr:MAG: hypothetical protein EON54_23085 [Alcaligenaceae bacterium]